MPDLDLNTYAPPLSLQDKQIWTLVIIGKRQEKVSEYNYTKKKMPLLSWPGVLKRYNRNPTRYAPVTGIVSREVLTIDIDVKKSQPAEVQQLILERLPDHIQQLVSDHPTLYHRSKSGKGWKVYYITDTPIPKMMTPHKMNDIPFGEIFQGMFVSTTDPDLSDFSQANVATITREELSRYIPEVLKEMQPRENQGQQDEYVDFKKSLKEVERILGAIPVDPDPLLEIAYETRLTDFECTSYHHWLLVSHALADLAVSLSKEYESAYDTLQTLFISWSSTGQSFVNDKDCIERFERSFNETNEAKQTGKHIATFQTLRKLFWGYRIPIEDFPAVKIDTKGNKTVDASDPRNYSFLTDTLKIRLVREFSTESIYVTGPTAIIKQFFSLGKNSFLTKDIDELSVDFKVKYDEDKDLKGRLVELFRAFGIKGALQNHPIFHGLYQKPIKTIDSLFCWMTSRPWDGTERVQQIIEQSITIDENNIPHGIDPEFYHYLIFKHLIHMAGIREKAIRLMTPECTSDDIFKKPQSILILAGPQDARKSTWVESLLPLYIPLIVNATQDTIKDALEFRRALKGRFALNIDEIDALFDRFSLSELKNVVTQNADDFRTMYAQTVERNPRSAGIFGTTNAKALKLDRTGNRRWWIIPVKRCDAKPLLSCDYQQFWAELIHYASLMGPSTWNLNDDEKRKINITAVQFSKRTGNAKNIEAALTNEDGESKIYTFEDFDFEQLFKDFSQKQFRAFTKHKILLAKNGSKAFEHLLNESFMKDSVNITDKSFEYEIENLTSNAVNMTNVTKAYRNMIYSDGVIKFYAKGKKNPPLSYHFIPYKDIFNRLRAEGVLPVELFQPQHVEVEQEPEN